MNRLILSFTVGAVLALSGEARAVIVANSTTNTSNPGNGVPWGNVGALNGATGIYLGNSWVLTAGHVGVGALVLDIGTFFPEGDAVQIVNPDGTAADMIMFRLSAEPNLPPLTLASSAPAMNSDFVMIGNGRIRGSSQKTYTWTDSTNVSRTGTGFDWSTSGFKSFGTNRVSSLVSSVFNTQSFISDFTRASGPLNTATSSEGQAAVGDSGGAAFTRTSALSNTWQLSGMMFAIGGFGGQPANTALYGNVTYYADIASYSPQIETTRLIPEPSTALLLVAAGGLLGLRASGRKRSRLL